MTTQYAEEQGFKKKYLAPLIVLMLCAVSLTGAAYAYSTTIEGNGDMAGDYYSIDLYSAKGTVLTEAINPNEHFVVETHKVVNNNYKGSVAVNTITYDTMVMVQSNKSGEACKITADVTFTPKDTLPTFYSAWAETGGFSASVTYSTADDPETPVTTFKTGEYYNVKITVTFKAIADEDLGTSAYDKVAEKLGLDGTYSWDNAITIKLTATN